MARPGAELARDVVACPGADTCNIAVTQSRGLAKAIGERLEEEGLGRGRRRAHQHLRLHQQLRPAPHRRHRLLRRRAPGPRPVGARLPDAARRLRRPGADPLRREGAAPAGEGRARGRRPRRPPVRRRAHGRRGVPHAGWTASAAPRPSPTGLQGPRRASRRPRKRPSSTSTTARPARSSPRSATRSARSEQRALRRQRSPRSTPPTPTTRRTVDRARRRRSRWPWSTAGWPSEWVAAAASRRRRDLCCSPRGPTTCAAGRCRGRRTPRARPATCAGGATRRQRHADDVGRAAASAPATTPTTIARVQALIRRDGLGHRRRLAGRRGRRLPGVHRDPAGRRWPQRSSTTTSSTSSARRRGRCRPRRSPPCRDDPARTDAERAAASPSAVAASELSDRCRRGSARGSARARRSSGAAAGSGSRTGRPARRRRG